MSRPIDRDAGDPADAARTLAARRARRSHSCEECGKPFEATARRRYCSNACGVRAWRRRRSRLPGRAPILIVDDDPILMESLTVCFEVHGFRVISAHSSAEALDVLGREMPALVLLDLNAPILDGPDFARELDRRGLSLPVVVMSSEPGAAEAARELGAVATLGKPFEVARLLATVGSIARTA